MASRFVIAIDQGTTGTTILLINNMGEIVHRYYKGFKQYFPKPGWVEHDPEMIWDTVVEGLKEIVSIGGVTPDSVAAIGLTNQRETVLVWDRHTGEPVYPAIVWQCRRTADRCKELMQTQHAFYVRTTTGLRIDPYFSATKIEWILNNVPGVRQRADNGDLVCGTIDTWLIWKLTKGRVHATDHSNACRTMIYDIKNLRWDDKLLNLFGVPKSMLPEVKQSSGYFGDTDPSVFGFSVPIAGVLGDQQAALFGQGCHEPGSMKNTYGTGCFLLMNTGSELTWSESGLLSSIGWILDGKITYVLEGSVFVAGAVVQWLRDELGFIDDAAESEPVAASVPDSAGVYLVPAFTGLGAPHWDAYARGTIVGLTRGSGKAHIVRAGLESIAYQVNEVIDSMTQTVGAKTKELRVDGGAAANNLLMQFQADICNFPIRRNNSLELTGIGSAFAAGISVGMWSGIEEVRGLVKLEKTFEPSMVDSTRQDLLHGWKRAVERAKGWTEDGR